MKKKLSTNLDKEKLIAWKRKAVLAAERVGNLNAVRRIEKNFNNRLKNMNFTEAEIISEKKDSDKKSKSSK